MAGASTNPRRTRSGFAPRPSRSSRTPQVALAAANRSRALQPMDPLVLPAGGCLSARNQQGRGGGLLLLGGIVSGDAALGREAMSLYSAGLDPDGCAIAGSGASAALNPQCAIVARHSCIASAAAYQIFGKSQQMQRAEQVKAAAVSSLGCPAELMDRANSLVP